MALHKKAKECGIKPSSCEENNDIFRKLGEIGDTTRKLSAQLIQAEEAAQRLVEGNMGYVVSRVEWFLDDHPEAMYMKDDLISEGFLTLAKLASKLIETERVDQEKFNPGGMISICLRNAFINLMKKEHPTEVPITDLVGQRLEYNNEPALDLKLDILDLCKDVRERKIVQLRAKGFNDGEVGEILGLPKTTVCRIKNVIYQRFLETQ